MIRRNRNEKRLFFLWLQSQSNPDNVRGWDTDEDEWREYVYYYRLHNLHKPKVYYGPVFTTFTKALDPLLVFDILKASPIQKRKRKRKAGVKTNGRFWDQMYHSADALIGPQGKGQRSVFCNQHHRRIFPIVVDTGASISITPVKSDFIGELMKPTDTKISGLTGASTVEGIGVV